jgi:hypothetical protein
VQNNRRGISGGKVLADPSTDYSLGNSNWTRCGQIPAQSIFSGMASCEGVGRSQYRVFPGEYQVASVWTDPSAEYIQENTKWPRCAQCRIFSG